MQEKQLIKAHVVTEFFYEELYNDKHQLIQISVSDNEVRTNSNIQKGIRDRSILCKECDGFFGREYEKYGRKVHLGGNISSKKPKVKSHKGYLEIQNVNFQKYYRFLLLQIWRMSISRLVEYSNIDLGTKHNNSIRSYLLDPSIDLNGSEYPIVIQYVLEPNLRKLIYNFGRTRDENGIPFYFVKMGLFIYIFYIKSSNHSLSKPIKSLFIKSDEVLIIPAVKKFKQLIFDTMVDTAKKSERRR